VTTLHEHLAAWASAAQGRQPVADTITAIATAARQLETVIAQGPLAGDLSRVLGASKDGNGQKALDVYANTLFTDHLRAAPVAAVVSEASNDIVALDPNGAIVVALDPLDGSNNIDFNAPMGTVFSLLPVAPSGDLPSGDLPSGDLPSGDLPSGDLPSGDLPSGDLPSGDLKASFLVPGSNQLAGGFVLYGPHTALVLTLNDGVDIFTLDPAQGEFILTRSKVRIIPAQREYAINASNARHWPLAIRAFIEECIAGRDGPRGVDYNTRWLGAVVSETFRVLMHGGIYLYPGDTRPGYHRGRLRLLYEANPIALLIEQAGGIATDGFSRILDLKPNDLHEHAPLIFGSSDKVERVMELYAESVPQAGQRPLFAVRGLFKS
jgi:fructose-1,6-bisphosphatase I